MGTLPKATILLPLSPKILLPGSGKALNKNEISKEEMAKKSESLVPAGSRVCGVLTGFWVQRSFEV